MTKEKEPNRERKSAKRGQAKRVSNRLGVFYLLILLAFVGLGVRLILITTKNNNEYQQRILSQQTYDSKTLTAKRGEIVTGPFLLQARKFTMLFLMLSSFFLMTKATEITWEE